MENKIALEEAYNEFLQIPFPEVNKQNSALTDWVSELADLDGFYAGLALSLIAGHAIHVKQLPSITSLSNSLEKLREKSVLSDFQYDECEKYLKALQELMINIKITMQVN